MKHTSYPAMARPMALRLLALLAAVYLVLTVGARSVIAEVPDHSRLIAGPTAWLLTASTDLGPAHKEGANWAYVEGKPAGRGRRPDDQVHAAHVWSSLSCQPDDRSVDG